MAVLPTIGAECDMDAIVIMGVHSTVASVTTAPAESRTLAYIELSPVVSGASASSSTVSPPAVCVPRDVFAGDPESLDDEHAESAPASARERVKRSVLRIMGFSRG